MEPQSSAARLLKHPERRRQSNRNCRVPIPHNALLYGLEAGIRCKRCYDFARETGGEWPQQPLASLAFKCTKFRCADCGTTATQAHKWGESKVCGRCNVARCCAETRKPGRKPVSTLLTCQNAHCDSTYRFNRLLYNLIQDVEKKVWRCLPCDYHYSMFGQEYPIGKGGALPEPEPVSHHRYNAIRCAQCSHYTSPGRWLELEPGIYTCTLCAGPCATEGCTQNLIRSPLRWDPAREKKVCEVCYQGLVHGYQVASKGHTGNQLALRRLRNLMEQKCRNEQCGREIIRNPVFLDGRTADEDALRCRRCARHYKKNGEEWRPPVLKSCYNPACTAAETGVGDQKYEWMYEKRGDTTSALRCRNCAAYFKRTGRERSAELMLKTSTWHGKQPGR